MFVNLLFHLNAFFFQQQKHDINPKISQKNIGSLVGGRLKGLLPISLPR